MAFPNGALALVHRAETTVEQEGTYAFSRDGRALVNHRSPIRLDGKGNLAALLVMCGNPAYPPETVTGVDLNEIRIAGRVRSYVVTV